MTRATRAWRQAHPERYQAQNRANNAQRDGHLTPPSVCERCGDASRPVQKHHPDYRQPLLVQWLCRVCHAEADAERRAREEADCVHV